MRILQMKQVGHYYYDPYKPAAIPQHKLEVWPGYITAIHNYEGDLHIQLWNPFTPKFKKYILPTFLKRNV